jgi:ATP-dependent DNA helicase RecQ
VYGSKRIVAMLHRLMEAGLARQKDPDGVKFRPVIELTAAGIVVMKGEQPPPAPLIDLIPRGAVSKSPSGARTLSHKGPPIRQLEDGRTLELVEVPEDEMDPDTVERFGRLRAVRTELARSRQLPPYCIVNDATLKQIARQIPPNLSALQSIKGMGPHKIKMYGDVLLQALHEN